MKPKTIELGRLLTYIGQLESNFPSKEWNGTKYKKLTDYIKLKSMEVEDDT